MKSKTNNGNKYIGFFIPKAVLNQKLHSPSQFAFNKTAGENRKSAAFSWLIPALLLLASIFISNEMQAQACSSYPTWTTGMFIGPAGNNCSGSGVPSPQTVSYNGNLYTHRGYCSNAGPGHWDFQLVGTCTQCTNRTVGGPSSSPTPCVNTVMTSITHATTQVTGIASSSGLPAGVSASYSGNFITISGTPTATGTFTYTITPTSDCGSATATGTITVGANNTVTSASSTPTVCISTAITNITHTTTGATGIANAGTIGANGLPAGVAASLNNNTITVFGTPSAAGTFNYSIPLTGGCGTVNATGTITVNANVAINAFSPATSTRCQGAGTVTTTTTASNSTGITYGLDATTAAFAGNSINASTGAVTYAAGWSGTTTITASAAGCSGPATTTHVVTVNALPTVSSATGNSKTYTGIANATTVSAAASAGATIDWYDASSGGTLLASGSLTYAPTGINAGTYPVFAQARNTTTGCTSAARSSATLTINKALLTITAVAQTVPYGTVASTVTGAGTYTATGFVNSETSSVIGGSATYTTTYTNTTAAGTAGVTITPVVTNLTATNYSFSAANGAITISKANTTITATGTTSFTYTGAVQGPTTSTVTGSTGAVTYSYSNTGGTTYGPSATRPTNAGTYQVIASVAADANYNSASSSALAFTINKAVLTITAANQTVPYGTAAITVTGAGTYTATGFVNSETSSVIGGSATYTTTYTNTTAAGTAGVTITPVVTNLTATNYSFSAANGAITISVATPTVTVTVGTYTYNASAQGPTAATNTGTGSSYTFSYVGTGSTTYAASSTRPTAAGTYTATATVAANGNFGSASSNATSFSISTKALTITANNQTKCAGTTFTFAGTEFTTSGLESGNTVTSATITSTGAPSNAIAGTYPIVASNAAGTGLANYNITYVNGTLTVNANVAISSQSTATQTRCISLAFTPITVTATGVGLTYQWYSNTTASTIGGTSLAAANGAETDSYTPQSTVAGTLYYYCVVSGTCGTAVTSAVSGAFITNNPISNASCGAIVTRWNLATAGSGATQLSIGTATSGIVNYYWQQVTGGTATGSGTFSGNTLTITDLPSGATIRLGIYPTNFQRININNGADKSRLLDVEQWGTSVWTSMESGFYGCDNLNITATDIPVLTSCTSMQRMFRGCLTLNGPTNINSWSTGLVTNMVEMFQEAVAFNQNIGNWNLNANVDMANMLAQSGMNCSNYAATLVGWQANTSCPTGRRLGAPGRTYASSAAAARDTLVLAIGSGGKGWTITDGGQSAIVISSQSTATQTRCINAVFSPITVTATGVGLTYQWYSNTTASTTGGTSLAATNGAQTNSYTPQSTVAGTLYYYCIVSGTCGTAVTSAVSGAFITNANVAINAFSPATSTRCQGAGTVITTTTASNSTGITYGLDATTAAFAGNSIVAATGAVTYAAGWSGTTTITASATGCNGPVTTTHVVTVTPTNIASAASSTPTLCGGTALTNILHTTTNASGIGTATGLPAGVTAEWAANTITIRGTPTASGTFNYSIPLTGGCGSVNATGTITVIPNNWLGVTSNSWNVATNWSCGVVPTGIGDITISSSSPAPILDINLTLQSGVSLVLSGTGSLVIDPTKSFTIAGTADFGGKLVTLKSDTFGTGAIGQVTGSLINATNLTVERYIPANGRRFRFLASPVVGGTSLEWRDNAGSTPGRGTQITGAGTADSSLTGNPSAYKYTEDLSTATTIGQCWEAIEGNTNLVNGKGYRVLVRGDRSISLTTLNSDNNATTLWVNGAYPTGIITLPVSYTTGKGEGWNLVGNPYPCTIDYEATSGWAKTNMGPGVAIYRPSTNSYAYSVSTGGANPSNLSTNGGSQYIASGQSFFVKANGVAPSLTCTEAVKVTNQGTPINLFKGVPANQLRLTLTQDSNNIDEALIAFATDYKDAFDNNEDIVKLPNSNVNISSVFGTDKYAAINLTSKNYTEKTIPLSVWSSKNGNLQLSFSQLAGFDAGVTIFLRDKFLNTTIAINQNKTITVNLADNSKGDNRFELIFKNASTSLNAKDVLPINALVYPNPATDLLQVDLENVNFKNSILTVYNLAGAKMLTGSINSKTTLNIENWSSGVYFVNITNENGFNKTIKFIK
jgi:hypothetical protein